MHILLFKVILLSNGEIIFFLQALHHYQYIYKLKLAFFIEINNA